MNTDIRLKTSFMYHHKTLKLEKKLGPEGVLALIRLWLYVATNHPKGDISKLDNEDIAAVCLWHKEPSHLVNTLIEVGFIDEWINEDGSISRKIHDWEEHNRFAYYAEERVEIARKNAERRWSGGIKQNGLNKPKNANGNAVGMQSACNLHANGNAPSPIPSPSPIPIPKEYVCAEVLSDKTIDKNCTQSDKSDFVPSSLKKKVSFDGCSFKGTEEFMQLWKEAYPLVNVEQEIKQMEAWVISQPKSRWKKDWKRFITSWLAREQDRAEIRASGNSKKRKTFLEMAEVYQ